MVSATDMRQLVSESKKSKGFSDSVCIQESLHPLFGKWRIRSECVICDLTPGRTCLAFGNFRAERPVPFSRLVPPVCIRLGHHFRQERTVFSIKVARHLLQYKLQVIVRIGAISPGCLDKCIDNRVRLCTVDTCREQICPPSHGPQASCSSRHSRCQEGYSHSPGTGTGILLVPCVHDGIFHLVADPGSICVKLIRETEG